MPRACGTLLTVGVNVCHDIVAHFLFLGLSHGKINILNVGSEFVKLCLGDPETDLRLGFGQRYPETAPGLKFVLRRKEPAHVLTGITFRQRVDIVVVAVGCLSSDASFSQRGAAIFSDQCTIVLASIRAACVAAASIYSMVREGHGIAEELHAHAFLRQRLTRPARMVRIVHIGFWMRHQSKTRPLGSHTAAISSTEPLGFQG